jgi:predicted Zn-dependent peptidase
VGHDITELAERGIRVASERIGGVRSVALGFWIGVGSRDEPTARAGVSHFIEHLLFKGSSRYSALDIAERFDGMGSELNAATSRETTVVYVRVPDERLEAALDVITDMVLLPTFADLETEREVVLEEIAMVDDNPQDLVHDLAAEAVFGSHPLGRPVIGSASVISGVTRRALKGYHASAYAPANIVVAAAGNVDHGDLVEMVRSRADSHEGVPGLARRPLKRPPQPGFRFLRKETEQVHLCLASPGIARNDERRYAASLLDAILGGSASSRLFQEIREKRGMAYSVYSYASQYVDGGQVGIYLGTREENLVACMEIVEEQLTEIGSGGVTAAELQRAKDNMRGRILLGLESTSARMTRLGKALVTGSEIVEVDETIARIADVTADELAALARAILRPSGMSVAAIGPREARVRKAVERLNPALVTRAA